MMFKIKLAKYLITPLLLVLLLLIGCDKDEKAVDPPADNSGVFVGETKVVNGGNIKSWVQINETDEPTAIGITIDETVLNNLPMQDFEIELGLPTQASKSAFNHITLGWNHMGHEPNGIYNLPHFDFHYYMIKATERMTIPAGPDPQEVSPSEIPPDYFSTVDAVPQMGVHYLDGTAAELNGAVFTETFIYGYYFGKMIFLEPMITLDYLKTKPNLMKTLKLPAVYPTPGLFYPKTFSVKYDSTKKVYEITLLEFFKY